MRKFIAIEVQQPIGTFYIGKMKATDIIAISKVSQRKGSIGHQRQLKAKRAEEIALYCQDPDATFPTPIILSARKEEFVLTETMEYFMCFEFDETKGMAEIIDGQHRIAGIKNAEDFDCDLPVILMFDMTEEQKAYVFSTINGNQVKVDKSLIFDLFELSETRSPYQVCHQIARALNSDSDSPLYSRLKMLEKRENLSETISQNTFVTKLCELISARPQEDAIRLKKKKQLSYKKDGKTVLRQYFIIERDDVILRILYNYFQAAASVFEHEWNTPEEYILTKTVGFSGLMQALKYLIPKGEEVGDLSQDFFARIFRRLADDLNSENISLTSEFFPSNSQSATALEKKIYNAMIAVC